MDLSTICQQIILASSSRSRIEYLKREKIDFEVRPHKIDERIIKKENNIYKNCGRTSRNQSSFSCRKRK